MLRGWRGVAVQGRRAGQKREEGNGRYEKSVAQG
jgi:hypothetical protein